MIGIEELRENYPGWRIWRHEVTGVYHAMRRVQTFTQSEASRRRFAVAAATLDELDLLLAAQAFADHDEIMAGMDQHTGQRGDGSPDPPR